MGGPRPRAAIAVAAVVVATTLSALAIGRMEQASAPPDPGPTYSYPAQRPRVLFLGDSYAQGVGATSTVSSWARLVSEREGWVEENWARGGSGYLAVPKDPEASCGNPICPNYRQMLNIEPVGDPGLVIVSGGRNDLSIPVRLVRPAVRAFYTQLRRKYPNADIVALSPIWDSRQPPASLDTLSTIVKEEAARADGTYVDIGEPLAGHPEWITSDDIHPNDAGHAAIARAVIDALNDRDPTR